MITTLPVVGSAVSGASRRTVYRRSKRVLTRLLTRRWKGGRWVLEPAVRRFLRARPRGYLLRLVRDRAFALAAAAADVLSTSAAAPASANPRSPSRRARKLRGMARRKRRTAGSSAHRGPDQRGVSSRVSTRLL